MRILCWVFASLLCSSPLTAQSQKIPRKINLPETIKEVSGMTRLPNGDLWLLNDSKNPPELFRFDPVEGKLLETRLLPVQNIDWEDLAYAPDGSLFIGDFGNNHNRRQNLRIFKYNPLTGHLDSIQFCYPDQREFPPAKKEEWNFNCEAMVYWCGTLHLFSKNVFRGNFYTKHYVLPANPGEHVAELRDSIKLKNRVVTGAALSKDGKTLALTGYIVGKKWGFLPFSRASLVYFTGFPPGQYLRGKQRWKRLPQLLVSRQFEAVTQWNDCLWLVANEGRGSQVQRIWRAKK